ncbi:hypothetical protein COX86_00550 [Candidatus Micrarchaeota archaeon CG_4_10_14_0_2_um_filter_60_11]|nr:MAG: hypothetical protein AUJ16_00340 [Candidatus Micrarchaeota archaeon CG1_02_60_51]PIN96664.1 MAG: hypothetical protein COU39_00295 [Candidatus Micrarchaeota archaeon CG10_big_fil_rev_8_21_14_0_10_60_32]PIO02407.1 MAG: hypothetical protein COT58_00195 [Candidatus Micrarchaeota archaeon CG09_land_8_20_14_0_10_60_16]PIY91466.1 MAG: hypothetical protein COY71_03010 [Candidatus Micrarchaeota archaeon CG_4_10_14_0_8_um_filter_60_7]PIZ91273.1 MAG: hypothetical protein COX86_00550 [Candidatus Mi
MRTIVVPGEKVADEPRQQDEACFADSHGTFASVVSLADEGRVIPLKGRYLPILGDYVIGIIKEMQLTGYIIDLNSPYEARLSDRDCREEYRIGDVISAKISSVNEVHDAGAMEPRAFQGGELLEVEPVKVPRIIGRNGSMLATIKEYTDTQLFVGKNGRIYLKDGNTVLASLAVLKICREAHIPGLTERMTAFLQEESKKVKKNEE